jgi:2-keto-4-pentenoate hydratase/2-oxohepta-3-ene-1,7-dioic acid hydratase in catechol pathway
MRFSAPLCPPTGDVIAIGRNYAEHAGEMARAGGGDMERPTVFSKAQTSVSGPADRIAIDARVSTQIDWEAELGVVIGRTCRNVRPEDALACVFGYTVLNDISARDLQYGWGGQFYKGKSLDGYCPIGPWIVTADEVADPQNLEITLRVNGEVKQRGHTSDMIFPVSELISQLSLGQTLRPGTLIATGTPPGVGYARDPKEFLRPGDVMETEIAGIGLLRNRVVAAEDGLDPDELHPGG